MRSMTHMLKKHFWSQ